MRALSLSLTAAGLAAIAVAGQALARPAPDTLTLDFKVNPTGAKAVSYYMPQMLKLSKEKPAAIKKAPAFKGEGLYGLLAFGDAKDNQVLFALDRPAEAPPTLYVDANRDGDLTNDPPVRWTGREQKGQARDGSPIERTVYSGDVLLTPRYQHGRSVPLGLSVYHFVYKTPPPPDDSLSNTILYYRRYAGEGTAKFGKESHRVLLVDESSSGRFDQTKHGATGAPGVQLLIDRDGDGKFDLRYEAFDLSKPFSVDGTAWEVASIDPTGARLVLKKSDKQVTEVPIPVRLTAGKPALPFEATDMAGAKVDFPKSYQGKLVMLDFWATWCGPCRGEIPYLVKAYEKYHSQGFEVLGISLDQEKQEEKVKAFLAEQKMPWPQVYDGKFWNAAVAKQYGIDSIPHAFLIDGNTGKVVAEGNSLRGESLDATIGQALSGRGGH